VKKSGQMIQGRTFHDVTSTYFLPMVKKESSSENDTTCNENTKRKMGPPP
jgi:hypothetical protein